jgi:multiple sugar transport system ATP-binding protein
VEVRRDIHLAVDYQSFVVPLCPTGSGKTTLLGMAAGLESISEGEIRIRGKQMNGGHPRNRDSAMVFQNYAPYPIMKVYNNIAFSLQVKGMEQARDRQEGALRGRHPGADQISRSLPQGAFRRAAAARGHGAGLGARPCHVPVRRTPQQSRR